MVMTYHRPGGRKQAGKLSGSKVSAAQSMPVRSLTCSVTDCQKVSLRGPEDITIDHEWGVAFISSQMRQRRLGGKEARQGGVFCLDLNDPAAKPGNLTENLPEELIEPDGAFHPWGISLYRDERSGARRLFVINHRNNDPNLWGRQRSTVEVFDVRKNAAAPSKARVRLEHVRTLVDEYHLVFPNNLAATGLDSFYLVNNSGVRFSFLRPLEFLLPLGLGTVVYCHYGEFTTVTNGIKDGVGIAVDRSGHRLYVSAFSDKKILVFEIDPRNPGRVNPTPTDIPLPIGPDNLEWDKHGNLWVAGSPSPLQTGAYIIGLWSEAPSMVIRIEAGDPHSWPQIVFTDDGTNIKASSVAAYYDENGEHRLLIGAPCDDHVVICEVKP
jgi:hypothetical protein